MNSKYILSKSEMKLVMGGTEASPPSNCSIACMSGDYACCNTAGTIATCHCNPSSSTEECRSGGAGANYCEINAID